MSLITFEAFDALADAFDGVADLPALKRNDLSLEGFADSGTTGIGWTFSLVEGGFTPLVYEFGEPMNVHLGVGVELHFGVEGLAGSDRDTVLRAAVAAMAGVLFPGGQALTVAGKFDDLVVRDIRRRHVVDAPGRKPIDLLSIELSLSITAAPTPLG